jgi:hypothetical protein
VTMAGCDRCARSADISSPLWGVSHVALRAFGLHRERVILNGVHDASEAMAPTWPASIFLSLRF